MKIKNETVYGKERPIPTEILAIARSVRRKTLKEFGTIRNKCTYCSRKILAIMKKRGFDVKITSIHANFIIQKGKSITNLDKQSGHTWIIFNDTILDVTADQFNNELLADKIRMRAIVYGTYEELGERYKG